MRTKSTLLAMAVLLLLGACAGMSLNKDPTYQTMEGKWHCEGNVYDIVLPDEITVSPSWTGRSPDERLLINEYVICNYHIISEKENVIFFIALDSSCPGLIGISWIKDDIKKYWHYIDGLPVEITADELSEILMGYKPPAKGEKACYRITFNRGEK